MNCNAQPRGWAFGAFRKLVIPHGGRGDGKTGSGINRS